MTWSDSPHELLDGTVVEGLAASVARALDDFDPLSGDERVTLTEGQTRRELLHWLDDVRWCADTASVLTRGRRDMWVEHDPSDLYMWVAAFLSARVVWAHAATRFASEYDEDTLGLARAYEAFAKKADTTTSAKAMVADLKEHRRISPTELNLGKTFLGTPLGVLSLDDRTIVADEEEQLAFLNGTEPNYSLSELMVTKSTRAKPDSPFAGIELDEEPRWASFIDEVCDGDEEKAGFLQRALGYSLLGGNPEKATFVLWGPTRDNGKSTLMEAVKNALGDYADSAPAGLLMVNKHDDYLKPNPVLAQLPGKRLVDVSEPSAGAELDSAFVKKLTSGIDKVKTRQLNQQPFEFVPDLTPWMHCNALPVVRDLTGIDPRHMFVIEFTRSFGPDERDPDLWGRLTSEEGMSTILRWLLDGYDRWREIGLAPPASVVEVTRAWLDTSGTWLDRFFEEMCVFGSGERCVVNDFKAALAAYCDANGWEMMPMKAVNAYLRAHNVANRPSNGTRFYRGVGLLQEAVDSVEDMFSEEETVFSEEGGATRVRLL